jgi:hypothetical protein
LHLLQALGLPLPEHFFLSSHLVVLFSRMLVRNIFHSYKCYELADTGKDDWIKTQKTYHPWGLFPWSQCVSFTLLATFSFCINRLRRKYVNIQMWKTDWKYQNYWVSQLCSLFSILESRKRSVSETESISFFMWGHELTIIWG